MRAGARRSKLEFQRDVLLFLRDNGESLLLRLVEGTNSTNARLDALLSELVASGLVVERKVKATMMFEGMWSKLQIVDRPEEQVGRGPGKMRPSHFAKLKERRAWRITDRGSEALATLEAAMAMLRGEDAFVPPLTVGMDGSRW